MQQNHFLAFTQQCKISRTLLQDTKQICQSTVYDDPPWSEVPFRSVSYIQEFFKNVLVSNIFVNILQKSTSSQSTSNGTRRSSLIKYQHSKITWHCSYENDKHCSAIKKNDVKYGILWMLCMFWLGSKSMRSMPYNGCCVCSD